MGLRILLDNLEVAAEGATSPPRLLPMFWPTGTVRYHFLPSGAGRTYQTSRILEPFERAGLRDDLIVLYGLSHAGMRTLGGGAEGGTVLAMTGTDSAATRQNGGEADDPIAGGPSFDQVFLKRVPDLQRPLGYANAIADARVDSFETSAQCLSYAHETREVEVVRPDTVKTMPEHVPLMPERAPASLYAKLFAGFMPGGDTPGNVEAAKRALKLRKSVLDASLRELDRVHALAPSSEWPKIDAHADAVRRLEQELAEQLDAVPMGCAVPDAPDATLSAKSGSSYDYANPLATTEDATYMERVGKAHAAVLRAAFQCDLVRVGTFEWCPGTNHVAFAGMYPADPTAIYMHHPLSHRATTSSFWNGSPPAAGTQEFSIYEFFVNVHTWFNLKTAEMLVDFKNTRDVFGNSLLDFTLVPFITDVGEPADTSTQKPALILGGRALGMQSGTFVDLSKESSRSHNNLWVTLAQALFKTSEPLAFLTEEAFNKTDVQAIAGLWSPVR